MVHCYVKSVSKSVSVAVSKLEQRSVRMDNAKQHAILRTTRLACLQVWMTKDSFGRWEVKLPDGELLLSPHRFSQSVTFILLELSLVMFLVHGHSTHTNTKILRHTQTRALTHAITQSMASLPSLTAPE